jgi:hypothetical protein
MQLSGLDRITSKPVGGVVAVELTCATDFQSAAYDASTDCFSYTVTSEPFARYVFREDGASYTEQSVGFRGGLVRHTLSMEFTATDEAHRALSQLKSASGDGFVAIVTRGSGKSLLVGYSHRFKGAFPLRIAGCTHSSGTTPADFPTITVVLTSEDIEPSKQLSVV